MSGQDPPCGKGPGRRPGVGRDLVKEIIDWHLEGKSLAWIAIKLNHRGIPQPGGGSNWDKWCVRRVLISKYGRGIADEG